MEIRNAPNKKPRPSGTHPEDLERLLDAVLSVRTERVHERTSDTYSRSTQCNRLEDVACASDTAVHEYSEPRVRPRSARLECLDDVDEVLKPGPGRVELASAMVRKDNPS